jgi:hypothetical protein
MNNLYNDTTNALLNAIDIQKTIESNNLNNIKRVHSGTANEDTLEDLINDVVSFLENLTEQLKENEDDVEYTKLESIHSALQELQNRYAIPNNDVDLNNALQFTEDLREPHEWIVKEDDVSMFKFASILFITATQRRRFGTARNFKSCRTIS